MSLGSKYERVHDAIYAEQVGSFRFERKIATSRGTQTAALNSTLQLRLILGDCVAWRVACV